MLLQNFLQSRKLSQATKKLRGVCGPRAQERRRTREVRGQCLPCPFIRIATGAEAPFHNSIIAHFMVCKDRLETNVLQVFAHRETSEGFSLNFWLFLGQRGCWRESSIIANNFLAIHKCSLPSTLLLPHCPVAAPASLRGPYVVQACYKCTHS